MTAAGGLYTTTAMADLYSPRAHDADAIYAAGAIAGTPVIPLVRMLAERVHFLGGP